MAAERKRWNYQDPSWDQIIWLYLGTLIFAAFDPNPRHLVVAVGLAVVTTALMAVKVIRARKGKPETYT